MKNVQVTHNYNLLSRTKQLFMLKFGIGSLHKKLSDDQTFFSHYLILVAILLESNIRDDYYHKQQHTAQ
jgi:hypothetical protein